MIIGSIVCFVLIIAAFIGYQVYIWREYIPSMNGMMIAMAVAMMVALTIGITISLRVVSNPTIATIYMMVLGVFTGYIIGFPFGILAQLDGVLSGIMGGLMGPMTGLMVTNSHPNLFIGFFLLLYVFTIILIYQLIQQSLPSFVSKKISLTWYVFLPICLVLTILAIVQSSAETPLLATQEIKGIQKKGYQEATIQVNENGYSPSNLFLKVGIPTKLHFQKTTEAGCLSYLLIRDLGINKELKKGDNVISFTPNKLGKITFTCGMGMYQGSLTVE
ncbi:cupredoxin domain-containing protein [Shimazuella sp. AN120528]|uniref:cupredoxin domain-containing protein n=1 Tax=Shimazuella soli TaxID=1892854 RepID=UPI001F0DCB10|nr:cupredoxin domain-containing protein [Shimazuella soli]MCH5585543.1 cupredoxin domain-containing protein [Shimazuella soli]